MGIVLECVIPQAASGDYVIYREINLPTVTCLIDSCFENRIHQSKISNDYAEHHNQCCGSSLMSNTPSTILLMKRVLVPKFKILKEI